MARFGLSWSAKLIHFHCIFAHHWCISNCYYFLHLVIDRIQIESVKHYLLSKLGFSTYYYMKIVVWECNNHQMPGRIPIRNLLSSKLLFLRENCQDNLGGHSQTPLAPPLKFNIAVLVYRLQSHRIKNYPKLGKLHLYTTYLDRANNETMYYIPTYFLTKSLVNL